MTKAEFQKAHGAKWAAMISEPAFAAALMVCGSDRLKEIENLTPEQIEQNGRTFLANFQGHLKTESILLSLAVESAANFDMPEATYDGEGTTYFNPPTTATPKRSRKTK